MYYYGARYYDPVLSRFISADTIYDRGPQGLNRYSYALNNPIVYNDPSGHLSATQHNNPYDWETPGVEIGRDDSIAKIVEEHPELGYKDWQEALDAFIEENPETSNYWDEEGNWECKGSIEGKTLRGKPMKGLPIPSRPGPNKPFIKPQPPRPIPSRPGPNKPFIKPQPPSPPKPMSSKPFWKNFIPDAVTISLSGAGFTPWIIGGGGGFEAVYIFDKGWVIYVQGGVGGGSPGGGVALEGGFIWGVDKPSDYTKHFIEGQAGAGFLSGSVFFDPTKLDGSKGLNPNLPLSPKNSKKSKFFERFLVCKSLLLGQSSF